ncbi:MAG: hypothetical protein WCC37_01070 [Candidatus Sulfotelmatobacter sp.]|jgi:hypothetical protein
MPVQGVGRGFQSCRALSAFLSPLTLGLIPAEDRIGNLTTRTPEVEENEERYGESSCFVQGNPQSNIDFGHAVLEAYSPGLSDDHMAKA